MALELSHLSTDGRGADVKDFCQQATAHWASNFGVLFDNRTQDILLTLCHTVAILQ
jgi:hypothetical protein